MSHIRLCLSFFVAVSIVACTTAPQPKGDIIISVIGTNDVHGALAEDSDAGGIIAISAFVDALRRARDEDGGAVLVIDAGDMWQGSLESNLAEGAAVVAAYNAMGVTAAAIGNHEFDFGPVGSNAVPTEDGEDPRGALKQRAREARFPLLAANLIDNTTGQSVAWDNVQPSIIIEEAGVKIGIIGVVTSDTLVTTIAANTVGLRVASLSETITTHARYLRDNGAVIVIVAAHAGGHCTDFTNSHDVSSCDMSAEIMQVANRLEPGLVDHIVAGHKHNPIAHVVNDIAITSNHAKTHSFGRVDFRVSTDQQKILTRQVFAPQPTAPDTLDSYAGFTLQANADVERIAAQAVEAAELARQEEIGVTITAPFELLPDIESAIGNLMTRAMLESFDADIAVHNVFGGIRNGLPAGELTYGDIFEMFPFDNVVVILELTGADLRTIVARSALLRRKVGFSGMRVYVSCAADQMSVVMRRDDGREIRDNERVRVIANDFLALGGDGILSPVIPESGFEFRNDMPLTRDVLIAWLRARPGTLDPADFRSHDAPKWNLPERIPTTCQL
jgi:5'-nucleotidase